MSTSKAKRTDDTFARSIAGMRRLLESITPWLLDLGGWIFGGLLAFNLVILGALLTVGPVDIAVKVSTAAFALALPLDIVGFVLLRLVSDLKKVSIGEVAAKAFGAEGFSVENMEAVAGAEARQGRVALAYSYGLLPVAALLTTTGVTAAVWHMAWWIGVLFVVMVIAALGVLIAAFSGLGPGGRWRTPAGELEPEKSPSSST